MDIFSYAVQFTADPDGGFVVTSRDLPEVVTQGDTRAHAIAEAEGALQAAIEMRIQDGLPIPPASDPEAGEAWVAVPIATAMKAALYLTMREQGISRTDLALRLGVNDNEAQRILSAADQGQIPALETVLHSLGKRPELRVA
ncbi:MAG: type II toxin-antitoxin system HicB family antitoxin [Lamprobacter sp.]|uniref:type II toxin-antitoxin system HicB family antitoxin n=1 Tax=Lamprobacter sp. TaxID=3100796 RepID=UPI002B25D251|nr:type II toxin-antitoxin system HicB family antitoxin [Lamprobacter sp.]MEA3641714.1 type II toxin-antitoxin system HicB family antitoxin [Lamprobacter sp.]